MHNAVASRRLGACVGLADDAQNVVERLVQRLAVQHDPWNVSVLGAERVGGNSDLVHDGVRQVLVVVAGVELVPVISQLGGALLAVSRWVALFQAQNVREPLSSGVVEVLSAGLNHVALALVGAVLASEGLVSVLSGIAIRPQVQFQNVRHALGFHGFGQIPNDEVMASRAQTLEVEVQFNLGLS